MWRVDRREISRELRGGVRTGRVVFFQEREQRETEAAFGETAWAAMACRATVRKQPRRRFALVEILGLGGGRVEQSAGERNDRADNEQIAPQLWLRDEFQ